MTEAKKFDQHKPDLTLIEHEFERGIAFVMGFGAEKYGRENYKKGMAWSRVMAAVLRHLGAVRTGELIDPESLCPHLHHAAAGLMILDYYIRNNKGRNDLK